MQPAHRTYLKIDCGLIAAAINLVLNGLIAWALYHSMALVPLWGSQSIAGDSIATALLLPFLTSLMVTPNTRREIAKGRFPVLQSGPRLRILMNGVFQPVLTRALLVGCLSVLIFASLTVALLWMLNVQQMTLPVFIAYKAGFAAALAALTTPVTGWWALHDAPPGRNRVPASSNSLP